MDDDEFDGNEDEEDGGDGNKKGKLGGSRISMTSVNASSVWGFSITN